MILTGILIAAVVVVLAIPFDVKFAIRRDQAVHSDIVLHWLFGMVRIPLSSEHGGKPTIKSRSTGRRKKTTRQPKKLRTIKSLLLNATFRHRLLKLAKDVFQSIHIGDFNLRVRLGLDDPADTGRLWACLGPLSIFLNNLSDTMIHLEPDFSSEIVYVDSSGRIRFVPLQVIGTVLAFVFSPVTIRALWLLSRSNKI